MLQTLIATFITRNLLKHVITASVDSLKKLEAEKCKEQQQRQQQQQYD